MRSLIQRNILPSTPASAVSHLAMLSRFFPLRRQVVSSCFLTEKHSYFTDTSRSYNLFCRHGISTASSESSSGKAYVDFAIFKGKAALFMSPKAPTFTEMDPGRLRVDRKGVVLLKFIPAIGQRKYDSEKKQIFALSATEVGSLISLGPAESCEFFHDPSMKSSLEGQVKKTFTISPLADGSGYMFNLSVLNNANKTTERFVVPVTKAEFSVMRTACSFALPHIMGWDRAVGLHLEHSGHGLLKQTELKMDPDLEWRR